MADKLYSEKSDGHGPMNRVQVLALKASEDRLKEPTITKINADEKKCVQAMFKLYDIGHTGSIAVHHARKLLKNMGFEAERIPLGSGESDRVTMRDLLMVLESELPQPNPSLPCSLYTFDRIVGKLDEEDGRMKIRPDEIMKFMQVCSCFPRRTRTAHIDAHASSPRSPSGGSPRVTPRSASS